MQAQRRVLWMLMTCLVTGGFGCQSALYFDRSLIPNDAGVDAGVDAGDAGDGGDSGIGIPDAESGDGGDGSVDASEQ